MIRKREEHAEAQRVLDEITDELKDPHLTAEQRTTLEHHAAGLAGFVLSPWLPVSWGRRLVMVAIVLLGLQQAHAGNYQPLLWWLLLPLFSPRLMGEAAYLLGKIRGP